MIREQKNIVHSLGICLKEHGIPLSINDVRSLAEGQLAAPDNLDPDAWIELIQPNLSEQMRKELKKFKENLASLDVEKELPPEERLAALRVELISRRLDGFLVPLSDEYQSEFPPSHSQRLAWVTGFTGSAGMAVVLQKSAAILVDGRYSIQVRKQTNPKLYEPLDFSGGALKEWLKKNAKGGARIGFDPWLHSQSGFAALKTKFSFNQVDLVQVETNPIDQIWTQQPPLPLAPVYIHPVSVAGRASEEKIVEIASVVKENGADAAIITSPDSIAWLLNIRGGDIPNTPVALGFLIINIDRSLELFMDERKILSETRNALGKIASIKPIDKFEKSLKKLCHQSQVIQISPSTIPVWVRNYVMAGGGKIIEREDPCVLPKACKNSIEIQGIRNAHIRDGVALCRFLYWLSEEGPKGVVDEMSAADQLLKYRIFMDNFKGLSFETISGAGSNGAIIHYRVTPKTNRNLEYGSLYLVDSGAQYIDGTTDVTRTVSIGPPAQEMQDRFTRVLKGHIAIAMARFPAGTSGGQLDCLARKALWEVGLDFNHGTGHGVGAFLSVHEGPQRIAKRYAEAPLRPGMVLSNEPGYYKEGAYGIRLENLLIVRKEAVDASGNGENPMFKFDTVTLAPIDISLVDESLLSSHEINWLNKYHSRVLLTIGPFLNAKENAWLEGATSPLGQL